MASRKINARKGKHYRRVAATMAGRSKLKSARNRRQRVSRTERALALWPATIATMVVLVSLMFVVLFSTKLTGMLVLPDTDPPVIYGPTPASGSYVPGGVTAFYVHASDQNMNDSSVTLTIKALANPGWDTYSMPCVDVDGTTGACDLYGTNISLNIVGSDTEELYYFSASDLLGNSGSLGSVDQPMFFTVDTNPPEILLVSPVNGTYVSNNTQISITAVDVSSGVNDSTVAYSFDNSSWVAMVKGSSSYYTTFDTSNFGNNDTASFYFKAADVMGNVKYAYAQFLVDNELPGVTVTSPPDGANATGVIHLTLTANDLYSGVKSASFSLPGYTRDMYCSGPTHSEACEGYLNTVIFPDGPYSISFEVLDLAGNAQYSVTNINIDNRVTALSITSPVNGSYLTNATQISSIVTNGQGKAAGVQVYVSGAGYSALLNSTCDSNLNCYVAWDTAEVADGQYTLLANATGSDLLLSSAAYATVDNTAPTLSIDSPINSTVNGTALFRVVVTDAYGVDVNSVNYSISTFSDQPMYCSMYVQNKKYVCSATFDTTKLPDGYYGLSFSAADSAGNTNIASKTVLVGNSAATILNPGNATDYTQTTTASEAGSPAGTTTPGQEPAQSGSEGQNTVPGSIAIMLGDAQNSLSGLFGSWPFKALAVSMIIFLAVLALFRTTSVKRFLGKKEGE